MEYKSIFDLELREGPMIFPDTAPTVGDIRLRATANCGICASWEDAIYPTKKQATAYIKSHGWVLTKTHGWICPVCCATTQSV